MAFHTLVDVATRHAALFQILLVIVLRAPEFCRGSDFSNDLSLVGSRFVQSFFGRAGRGLLLRRLKEYRTAILFAVIGTLPVELGGVVVFPKDLEDVGIGGLFRIESNFHHFRMARLV